MESTAAGSRRPWPGRTAWVGRTTRPGTAWVSRTAWPGRTAWVARATVIAVVVATGLLGVATPAHAHGQLAMSRPVKDSTVTDPLQRVELYFTEQPASNAHFTVTTPAGVRVDGGWSYGPPQRLDEPVQEYFLVDGKFEPRVYNTGFPALITVSHWPEKGAYKVSYLSVASDGEAVRGTVNFTYGGPTGAPPPGWKAPTDGPAESLTQAVNGGRAPTPVDPATPGIDDPDNTPEASGDRGGTDAGAWLVPALFVAAVAAMLVHAARRPAAAVQPAATRRRKAKTTR